MISIAFIPKGFKPLAPDRCVAAHPGSTAQLSIDPEGIAENGNAAAIPSGSIFIDTQITPGAQLKLRPGANGLKSLRDKGLADAFVIKDDRDSTSSDIKRHSVANGDRFWVVDFETVAINHRDSKGFEWWRQRCWGPWIVAWIEDAIS